MSRLVAIAIAAVLATGLVRSDPVPPRSPIAISLARGSVEAPSAVFPLKPQMEPLPFAWTADGFLAGRAKVPWDILGVTPQDGKTFEHRMKTPDGDEVLLKVVLLNDTDCPVEETIAVKGVSAQGKDIFGHGLFDFSNGSCRISMQPRESLFLMIDASN